MFLSQKYRREGGRVIFRSVVPKVGENGATPFLPYTSMHFALPTSGLDMPCAVPNFTGIPAVIVQPASSVFVEVRGGLIVIGGNTFSRSSVKPYLLLQQVSYD